MTRTGKSIAAAITLFFVAPLVAEYLLGDLPLTMLAALIMMAPLYGGGALLIRELARRAGRGWPTMLLLGAAYTLIEEGFTGQTLFNPDAMGLHLHLLAPAWIPALGIGAWWTLFMFNVHIFWSMGVSIALVEALFPSRAESPWLGKIGTAMVALVFAAGIAVGAAYTIHRDPFLASHTQFVVTGVFCVLFVCAGFLFPFAKIRNRAGSVPSPWLTGFAAFILGIAVFKIPPRWNWGAVAAMLLIDVIFLVLAGLLSRRAQWTALHTLSLAAGGAVAYGIHAFFQPPIAKGAGPAVILAGHIILLAAAIALIAVAAQRTRTMLAPASSRATVATPQ